MKLETAKGVRDIPPEEKIVQQEILDKIRQIFERYGFVPLETPIIERFDVLSAKYAGGSEILKETFSYFKLLNEAKIKSFIIAGSHDYSVSGRTFLDVLEKAGFCKICRFERGEEKILLRPCNYSGFSKWSSVDDGLYESLIASGNNKDRQNCFLEPF